MSTIFFTERDASSRSFVLMLGISAWRTVACKGRASTYIRVKWGPRVVVALIFALRRPALVRGVRDLGTMDAMLLV